VCIHLYILLDEICFPPYELQLSPNSITSILSEMPTSFEQKKTGTCWKNVYNQKRFVCRTPIETDLAGLWQVSDFLCRRLVCNSDGRFGKKENDSIRFSVTNDSIRFNSIRFTAMSESPSTVHTKGFGLWSWSCWTSQPKPVPWPAGPHCNRATNCLCRSEWRHWRECEPWWHDISAQWCT